MDQEVEGDIILKRHFALILILAVIVMCAVFWKMGYAASEAKKSMSLLTPSISTIPTNYPIPTDTMYLYEKSVSTTTPREMEIPSGVPRYAECPSGWVRVCEAGICDCQEGTSGN